MQWSKVRTAPLTSSSCTCTCTWLLLAPARSYLVAGGSSCLLVWAPLWSCFTPSISWSLCNGFLGRGNWTSCWAMTWSSILWLWAKIPASLEPAGLSEKRKSKANSHTSQQGRGNKGCIINNPTASRCQWVKCMKKVRATWLYLLNEGSLAEANQRITQDNSTSHVETVVCLGNGQGFLALLGLVSYKGFTKVRLACS